MKHESKCKLCGIPVSLEIDDSYAELGDPMKLIPLAACNRCADFRNGQTRTFDRIAYAARNMSLIKPSDRDGIEKTSSILRTLLERYMKLLSDYRKSEQPQFDEAVIDAIYARPQDLWSIIKRMSDTVPKHEAMLI